MDADVASDVASDAATAFNELAAVLDHPMIVVTTASGEARAGCLMGFHVQCGVTPPRYALWLSKANHTYRVAVLSETFAVHFLTEGDEDIAGLFGTETGDEVDKFAECDWTPGPDGVPLLTRCPNRFVGRRLALVDAGTDHTCIVLEPLDASCAPDVGPDAWLTFQRVKRLQAGHDAEERQRP